MARFADRETAALRELDHPNVARLYDRGEHDGSIYLALEYVSGTHLGGRTRGDTPVEAAVLLMEDVARTVEYIHSRGIIHGDLKPSNILLVLGPDCQGPKGRPYGIPKLIDFDISRRVGVQAFEEGKVVGTPSYMSPEQASGQHREIGPAIDIWALGVILYEMLSGRRPFSGKAPLELFDQIVRGNPLPLRQARPGLPAALEAICMRCLRPVPVERCTAGELADDLHRYRESARRPSLLTRIWNSLRFWRRG
jgi:serine/threonine protein kinase